MVVPRQGTKVKRTSQQWPVSNRYFRSPTQLCICHECIADGRNFVYISVSYRFLDEK